jgi:hypothetical protein
MQIYARLTSVTRLKNQAVARFRRGRTTGAKTADPAAAKSATREDPSAARLGLRLAVSFAAPGD